MRVIRAHGVPAPAVIASSSEPIVASCSFALMERSLGRPWDEDPRLLHPRVAEFAVNAWKAMLRVPVAELGPYAGRTYSPADEVQRWVALAGRCPVTLQAAIATVAPALIADAPPAEGLPHLVHGDFHYGNLLIDDGSVSAILDWEIASVGSPQFDLADLVVASRRAQFVPDPNPTGSVNVTLAEVADLADVSPAKLGWYVAASCFKYAVIIGYNYTEHISGRRVDPIYEQLTRTMHGLLDEAACLLAEHSPARA